jgi:hypothetical protein
MNSRSHTKEASEAQKCAKEKSIEDSHRTVRFSFGYYKIRTLAYEVPTMRISISGAGVTIPGVVMSRIAVSYLIG